MSTYNKDIIIIIISLSIVGVANITIVAKM